MEWSKFGSSFVMADAPPEDVFNPLPAAVYSVKVTPFGKYYLERLFDNFDLPPKLYGDVARKTERVIESYASRDSSTGVLFVGEKGSGKSLTAKHLCNVMLEKGVPVIVINSPYNNNGFCEFVKKIDQDCVVFIDEFEKLYRPESSEDISSDSEDGTEGANSQDKLLSLFDGVFSSKKLFILTANAKYNISSFLLNRPGRIYYLFEYEGLGQDFIQEYCEDNLQDKSYIGKILGITSMFTSFTFDMLQGLVEEMNRFGITPEEALDGLNIIRPDFAQKQDYSMMLDTKDGKKKVVDLDDYRDRGAQISSIHFDVQRNDIIIFAETPEFRENNAHRNRGVVLDEELHLCAKPAVIRSEASIEEYRYSNMEVVAYFLTSDLKEVDGKNGIYVYVNKDGMRLTAKKLDEFKHSFFNFSSAV